MINLYTYTFDANSGNYTWTMSDAGYYAENLSTQVNIIFKGGDSSNDSYYFEFSRCSENGNYGRLTLYEVWGHRVMAIANHTRGTYVSDVTSTDENAYPADGVHTDGYWYVKQS